MKDPGLRVPERESRTRSGAEGEEEEEERAQGKREEDDGGPGTT